MYDEEDYLRSPVENGSLDTWIPEYYKVPASKAEDAITHSLVKWKGLRPVVLRRHKLEYMHESFITLTDGTKEFNITDETCALCKQHRDEEAGYDAEDGGCSECPLFKHLGETCFDTYQPFHTFRECGNPEPMIAALKAIQ